MSKENLNDLLNEFEERARNATSENAKLYKDTEYDDMYDVDIRVCRHKGMGNSIQTIQGNKLSIMTATTSLLHTLLIKNVINKDELKEMIKMCLIGVDK